MTEQYHNPARPPIEQFEQLLPYAVDNPHGMGIWFEERRREGSYQVWQLSHVEYGGTTPPPFPGDIYHYHYLRWNTNNPMDIQPHMLEQRVTYPPAPTSDSRTLAVPQLCSSFLHQSENPDDMGRITEVYMEWARQNPTNPNLSKNNNSVLARLVTSSVVHEENPLANPSSRVAQALATLNPEDPHFGRFSESLSRILGGMLFGKLPQKEVLRPERENILRHPERVMGAVDLLDELGILAANFWFKYGVQRGGVFEVPGVLERTMDSLQSREGRVVLGVERVAAVESTVADYVGRLLNTYITDGRHDSERLQLLRKGTTTSRGAAGLTTLVHAGNGVITVLSEALARAGQPELPRLDPRNPSHLGQALIRIFQRFRLRDLTPEERTAQAEEDAMHVSIIDLLMTHLRGGIHYHAADAYLRYPMASTAELKQIVGGLERGVSPVRVDSWFRAKRRTPGSVSGWRAKQRGYGVLS